MNRITLLLFAGLHLSKIDCQPIVTDASNKRIMQWDSSYTIRTTEFRANSEYKIPYQYIVLKNNKVAAEYFRHDDSSYLFVCYNTSGRKLQRGLIKLCSDIFAINKYTVQVPVWNADIGTNKELLKDTTIYDSLLSYRRIGIWKETDTLGMIWKGNYKNGSRAGEWKEGILLCCNEMSESINDALYDSFRPYITHYFKNGVEVSLYTDSVFWPQIKGGWREYKLSANTIVWEKEKHLPKYNFKSKETIILYKHSQYSRDHTDVKKTVTKWEQNSDRIVILENGKQTIFQMLKFTGDEMILRIL